MVFTQRLRDGVRRGRIRRSVRIWRGLHVKACGRYPMEDGHIVIAASRETSARPPPSASLRGSAWGVDGTALVVSAALLAVRYGRRGNELAAAGFLVFVAGETLIVSGSAMDSAATTPIFGAGVALWAASLLLVAASGAMPRWTGAAGLIAAALFAVVALRIFAGAALTPLSEPLPFFAYPFLAITLVGWAWALVKSTGNEPC